MNTDQIAAEAKRAIALTVSALAAPEIDERVETIIKAAIEKWDESRRIQLSDYANEILRLQKELSRAAHASEELSNRDYIVKNLHKIDPEKDFDAHGNLIRRAAHASEQLSTLLSDIRVFLIRYRNGMIEHAEALKLQGRVDLYMSRASQRQTPATDDTKRLDFLEHCEVKETCQVATAVIHGATYREAIDAAMSQTKEK